MMGPSEDWFADGEDAPWRRDCDGVANRYDRRDDRYDRRYDRRDRYVRHDGRHYTAPRRQDGPRYYAPHNYRHVRL